MDLGIRELETVHEYRHKRSVRPQVSAALVCALYAVVTIIHAPLVALASRALSWQFELLPPTATTSQPSREVHVCQYNARRHARGA